MLTRKTLARINERPNKAGLWPLVAIGAGSLVLGGVLFVLASSPLLALATVAAGVLGAVMLRRTKSTVSLAYDDLEGEIAVRFTAVSEACKDLATSEKICRLSDSPEQRTLKAGDIFFPPERGPAKVGPLETPGIRANVPIWGIDAGDRKILFFPDGILIYRSEHYEGLSYKSFKADFSPTRFFEEEAIPEDAEVVGRTWRYTREDGSPDRRYTPNPQIPVILYGLIRITGPSGLDVRLQVSNRVAAERFARAFGAGGRRRAREEWAREGQSRRATAESSGQERARPSAEEAEAESPAHRVLGVAGNASMGEITTAYRKLALTYHPDKVAHLKPEVREYADQKMKEINAAYAELKLQSNLRPAVSSGEPANSEEG